MRCVFATLCGIAFTFLHSQSIAQHKTYSPRKTYTREDVGLIKTVNSQLDDELNSFKISGSSLVELNEERKKYFRFLLHSSAIIKDDTLQSFISSVVRRIETSNELTKKYRYFFVVKDPSVNASCLGNGVFLINTGLLGRITSEDELAFTLAHEMAHDELHHNAEKMTWLAKNKFQSIQRRRIENLLKGQVDFDELKAFRKMNFDFSRVNRSKEFEADSLGLVYFRNAKYDESKASDLLQILEERTPPKYQLSGEVFMNFHTDEYPFQEYWLNDRLSVFSKKPEDTFLFSLDSMKSHPDIPERINKIDEFSLYEISKNTRNDTHELMEEATKLADFEVVESAFFSKQYDRCLLQALVLLQKYPADPYLVSRIAGVFLQLAIAKQDDMTRFYLRSFTNSYSEELKLINNFLHNLTNSECKEVLYHFLKNPRNFDQELRDHYFILWKVCELTYRFDERNQIADSYRNKFHENIASHDYKIQTVRKLNIFDFIGQWGWVFGI